VDPALLLAANDSLDMEEFVISWKLRPPHSLGPVYYQEKTSTVNYKTKEAIYSYIYPLLTSVTISNIISTYDVLWWTCLCIKLYRWRIQQPGTHKNEKKRAPS